ncbi:MAG: thiolase family protein [Desulfobacteraceae bacterium]|nr:thiolase family protein [Desulfobacteraceae bacterium]
MRDAYIVTAVRTPGCKQGKGAFKQTRPEDLGSFILKSAVEQTKNLEPGDIDDVMVGCSFPEAEQGFNLGRIIAKKAGLPDSVSGATVNRFCSSGLEAIAQASLRVMSGWSDITVGGGVESMSIVPMGGNKRRPDPGLCSSSDIDLYMSMGITAENVARRYNVSREQQDEFAYNSQIKAAKAQKENLFTEIVPTPATTYVKTKDGTYAKKNLIQTLDDGVRPTTTREGLAKLNPAFAVNGTVTPGNSSQTTDGAAMAIIASKNAVETMGLRPVAKVKCYTTIGCKSDEMGVGPVYAIPKLLRLAGLTVDDIGLFELNEAFASQALYCARELKIDLNRINVNGGAIALGHPLGCTGAKLCATLLANMKRLRVKYGVESMCIGGGMGAAALFELCDD